MIIYCSFCLKKYEPNTEFYASTCWHVFCGDCYNCKQGNFFILNLADAILFIIYRNLIDTQEYCPICQTHCRMKRLELVKMSYFTLAMIQTKTYFSQIIYPQFKRLLFLGYSAWLLSICLF
jgi:hypothetical protein